MRSTFCEAPKKTLCKSEIHPVRQILILTENSFLSKHIFFSERENFSLAEWWSSWGKQTSLSASSHFFSSPHGLRLDWSCSSTRPSCYYGNTIWAYQDLEPKDILDNNTIAAQPGYLRDLDLRGEIWGVADWETKSSLFLCLPRTQPVRISLLLENRGSGTICD